MSFLSPGIPSRVSSRTALLSAWCMNAWGVVRCPFEKCSETENKLYVLTPRNSKKDTQQEYGRFLLNRSPHLGLSWLFASVQ